VLINWSDFPSKVWFAGMRMVLGNGLVSCERSHPNDDHIPEVINAAIVSPSARGDARIDEAAPGRGLPSNCISDDSLLETSQCPCSLRTGSSHLRYIGSVEKSKFVSFSVLELLICQDRKLIREIHDWQFRVKSLPV
jgi:hypothetical protein